MANLPNMTEVSKRGSAPPQRRTWSTKWLALWLTCVPAMLLLFFRPEIAARAFSGSPFLNQPLPLVDNHESIDSIPLQGPSKESQGGDVEPQFTLRHIFHHGTGAKHYKKHRRLDLTAEVLARSGLDRYSVALEISSALKLDSDSLLDDILDQTDWPRSRAHENPWTVNLPIRTLGKKSRQHRLKERHAPGFVESYLQYAIEVRGNPAKLLKIGLEWTDDEISVPDVKDKETVVLLALISLNAYVRMPRTEKEKLKLDWMDVGEPWHVIGNLTEEDSNFGWDENGVRGHVFVSSDNKTVVIGIKGTSGAGLTGSGPGEDTATNDKTNDNLLFLCCCARVGYMWNTVCDCYEQSYTCNQDCLEREMVRQDRYYLAALDIYKNVTAIYPPDKTDIWVTGHSLGGALASLLGRTFGLPAVAFEAPGEMLATKRLHLPQPPGLPKYLENIWHFGNTGDPLFLGVCNGVSSTCNAAGYAMETACHTGKQCVYDVVTDFGWSVSLLNHRIHTVIDDIIMKYNETAECFDQPPCRDCFNWRFVSHDDDPDTPTEPTTTTTPKPQPTSEPTGDHPPEKCLKRTWYGWCVVWGPLDNDTDPTVRSKWTAIN